MKGRVSQENLPFLKGKSRKNFQKVQDLEVLASTERCQKEPCFYEDGTVYYPDSYPMESGLIQRKLYKPRRCYVCKEKYVDVHHFYHQLCLTCSEIHYKKRSYVADLTGRTALVTGGRIKIGYEIVLKLLRAGANVMVTTRFKQSAAARYSQEFDFEKWKDRLVIYELDLRFIPSVESFLEHLLKQRKPIDIIINNAAQTIRKTDSFYQEMAIREQKPISEEARNLLDDFKDEKLNSEAIRYLQLTSQDSVVPTCTNRNTKVDEFNEPLDMQSSNSWLSTLESVDTLEYLEAQVINSMAPFLFNSRLKPLMKKSQFNEKFIVNVSAMEGQFNRENKTHRHPHTNMAKASLNMMTRTSAIDYKKDNIFMNSVDTGWVTEENPFPIKKLKREQGVVPPLDCIDGASRILAPIYDAINGGDAVFGKFLKDYQETDW